jgi:asparagine synthase (glutamine-hydrolysing)
LCTPEFLRAAGPRASTEALVAAFAESETTGFLDALQDVDIRTYLADDLLVKVDIATMAFGLESRSPLLDHEVLEYAARLPDAFRLQGLQKKRILRQIARRYVPANVIDRPKRGFGVPIDRWFRQELRDLAHDVLLSQRLRDRGYFNQQVIEQMLVEHQTGRRDRHYQLWNLLMFELWHRLFVDGEGLAERRRVRN